MDIPAKQAPIVSTGETVTVGCKLPNGVNLGHLHGDDKPVVMLNGANHPNAIADCGLTHGIDKAAFERWLSDHGGPKGIPAVRLGLIFFYDKPGGAVQMAKEMIDEKTGLEGLDPDAPGPDVQPEDDQKPRTAKAKAAKAQRAELAELAHRS